MGKATGSKVALAHMQAGHGNKLLATPCNDDPKSASKRTSEAAGSQPCRSIQRCNFAWKETVD